MPGGPLRRSRADAAACTCLTVAAMPCLYHGLGGRIPPPHVAGTCRARTDTTREKPMSSEQRRRQLGEQDAPVEDEIAESFDRIVAEGAARLARGWTTVLVTGTFGGLEVGAGVMAYLAVLHESGSHLLAGLAFGIGLVALLLAKSEL